MKLELAVLVESTETKSTTVQENFPKVFQGLGTMGDPYSIKMKLDAKPYAIHAPRSVPLPLREKVKEEMEVTVKWMSLLIGVLAWLLCRRNRVHQFVYVWI